MTVMIVVLLLKVVRVLTEGTKVTQFRVVTVRTEVTVVKVVTSSRQ